MAFTPNSPPIVLSCTTKVGPRAKIYVFFFEKMAPKLTDFAKKRKQEKAEGSL